MDIVRRIVGAFCLLAALVVFVHFSFSHAYDIDLLGFNVWQVLNFPMAAAIVIALALGFAQKRALMASEPKVDLRRHLDVNVLLCASIWLAAWFFWSWTGDLFDHDFNSKWSYVNPLFVLVSGSAGLRIWRGPQPASSE